MFCHSYPTWLNKVRQGQCSLSIYAGYLIREKKVMTDSLMRSGARMEGMVNICESSINVIIRDKLKRLLSLGQKAR